MTTRIHLTTEPEPLVMHEKVDGRISAVQLAIEVQGGHETTARQEFSDLLSMFPEVKLVHLISNGGGFIVTEVARTFDVPLAIGESAPDVLEWLDAYKAGAAKLAGINIDDLPFYVSGARPASGMLNARAVDLLRSASRWPAPLAQKAGLVTAAHVPPASGQMEFLVIVPQYTAVETVTVVSAAPIDGGPIYDVAIEWTDPTPGQWTIQTEDLKEQILELSDRFEESGCFVLPANPEAEQRLLQRVEERSASALWIAPLLGTLAKDPRYESYFQLDGHTYSGEAFHWLAQASVMTLFDIVVGGLLLPVSNTETKVSRRSSVLERLTRRLAGKAELEDLSKDVDDEFALYLALHKALWAHLRSKTPSAIWADIQGALEGEEATLVEAALTGNAPADMTAETWDMQLTLLSAALSTLADLIESESSAEHWLIRQFDDAIQPTTNPNLYAKMSELSSDEIATEYTAFLNDMRGNFDASAVLRNEFGAEAVAALAGQIAREDTMGNPVDVPALLRTLIEESKPLVERFEPNTGTGVFDGLWGASPEVVATHPNDDLLEGGMEDPLATLSRDPDARPDFRPDDKPMPILIPIADNPDVFNEEGSVEHMSGLGFLAQVYLASDPDEGANALPVHLNLIGFDDGDELFFTDAANSVDPMLPLPAPGAVALTIPFSGVPLSSPNLTDPGVGGQDGAFQSMQTTLKDMRAYSKVEASYVNAADKIPTPAYGTAIRPSAFWVPPSGVLPPDLRDGGNPFAPKRPANGSVFWHDDTPWLSRRRTAISGADISVKSAPGALPSLPKDVNPIALDDPRLTVESLKGAERHRDIFRAVGGVGTLGPEAVTIVLKDVSVSGNEALSDLKVGVISDTKSGPDVLAADQLSYDPDKRTLTIEVPERVSSSWLRLWFGIGSAEQSFSFADPKVEQGQDGSSNATSPLLLAPDASDTWGDWPSHQTLCIDGPRVSFEDLERWAANSGLWAETCGAGTTPAKILDALRFARAIFEEAGDAYADRLKSLPDPAVKQLKVGLAQADFTTAAQDRTHSATSYDYPIAPYARTSVPDANELIEQGRASELIPEFQRFIDAIFEAAEIELDVFEGELELTASTAKVPRGTVAHLRVSPVLSADFFETSTHGKPLTGIFLPRMTELSVGRVYNMSGEAFGLLFDGPSLAIEVMDEVPDLPNPLSYNILTIDASGRNRGYSVSAALPRFLRWVGYCDLVTQRWRSTGTPIYHWIDVAQGDETGPAIAVCAEGEGYEYSVTPSDRRSDQTRANLAAFESDAFDPRRPDDADFKRYRLRPAEEATVLGQFDWPEKSATYFRHRIELISRYAGAMRNAQFARYAVKHSVNEGGTDPWTARVAILCEPRAISLVRPQFRTYLPVQKRVSDKKREPANGEIEPTPIACVLSEPPFAQLGLADRLDVDIAAKPLFEVDPKLEMTGLRKEVSPDPLLSYFRVNDDVSNSAAVHVEGPAGLHFDAPNSTDPAWANSQFMLQLSIPAAKRPSASVTELEESFAGLILSRHADPGWSWSDSSASSASERIEDVWIETAQSQVRIVDDDDQNYVTVERPTNAKPIVRIRSSAIWTEASVEMVTLWEGFVDALLLKPLGANRYRLSVFRLAVDRSVTDDGHIDRPQLVSSIVFQGPAVKGLKILGAESLRATRQSEATLIEWARSGRDLTKLSIHRDGSEHSIPTTLLLASIDNGRLTFSDPSGQSAAIASPVAHRHYPLHLHRRLVAVLQKPSKQVGHKIDLFDRALLLDHLGRAQAGTNSGATSAVLAEMECRAEVVFLNADVRATLGAELDAALTDNADYVRYRSAAFPFLATSVSPGTIRQFRVHIRGASGPLDLSTLSLGIKAKRVPDLAEVEEVFGPDLSTIGGHALALDAVLYAENAETVIRVSGGRPDGTSFDVSPFELRFSDNTAVPFDNVRSVNRLEMVLSDSSTTPRWADVSLIHSNSKFEPTDPDKFDLDWLFGPNDGASVSLPADLAPERLNKLAEAQARLVGLSDSIPFG